MTDWQRRYPPLALIIAAAALAVTTLPSSLTLPQQNPSQTTEYAPVPGDQGQAPPGGSFAGLGLGEGSSLTAGVLPPSPLPEPPGEPNPKLPSDKNCIGKHQTEDPLSPPCVPRYQGDNFGATYPGVTGSEITVMYYFQLVGNGSCYGAGSSSGCWTVPPTNYYDMDKASDVSQFPPFRWIHDWSVYFNHRYQTYNRHVHVWAYMDNEDTNTVLNADQDALARSDAAKNYNDKHPFAYVAAPFQQSSQPYEEYMVQHGVLLFAGAAGLQTKASFQKYPGLIWGFEPTLDLMASMYSTYVCQVIKNNPVSNTGNGGEQGKPRVFGVIDTNDSTFPDVIAMDNLIEQQLNACGVQYRRHTNPYTGAEVTYGQAAPTYGTTNMQDFKASGVTTILYIAGLDQGDQKAAQSLGYFPEWVVQGDFSLEGNIASSSIPPAVWRHAWVVTPLTLLNADGQPVEPPCLTALLEVDPNIDRQSFDIGYACGDFFDEIRQMFIGIQLAGPRLTPKNMDAGFHAIPPVPSHDPTQPSCFYLTGDYTCVKDAVIEWWDPNAHPTGPGGSSASAGCWRMQDNGARYQAGQWPNRNFAITNPNNICNLFPGNAATSIRTTN